MKHKKHTKKDIIRGLAITFVLLFIACICAMFTACTPAETDVSEKSEYAIVRLPDGTIIQGNVDYKFTSSVGAIEIKINGVEYKTHWANVAIIESSK